MKELSLILMLLAAAPAALAGWNSGGGGELLEHVQNPWFLAASKSGFTYCVQKGEDFATSEVRLEELVERTLKWWDSQFAVAHLPTNDEFAPGKKIQVKVRTNNYRRTDCRADTDLRFQFGFVTPEQKKVLAEDKIDLTRYVGITLRTDYDREHLMGKGFIYISPDRGAMAFKGQNVHPHAWDEEWRLEAALMHEVGHVHGLAHTSASSSIMSEHFNEVMVSQDIQGVPASFIFRFTQHAGYFYPKQRKLVYDSCAHKLALDKAYAFFALTPADCFEVRYYFDGIEVRSWKKENEDGDPRLVGRAIFPTAGQFRILSSVRVWLPQEQKVFSTPGLKVLLGPSQVQVQKTGVYQGPDGVKRPFFLHIDHLSFQFGGAMPEEFVPDVIPDGSFDYWHDIKF